MTSDREILPTLDPIAFAGALVLAPLVVALTFFWLLAIPIFAVFFGTVPYLIFGTPVLLWMVTRFPISADNFAIGGMLAQSLFALCLSAFANLRPHTAADSMAFMVLWGIPFAIAWFMTFAWLYRRFYRPITR
jgi:hypothetical protein